MKKLGIAAALAGLFIVGCGDSGGGLVKLENKNPTIDQRKFDLYVEKLQESELKAKYETIKTSDYNFYHSDSEFEYAPIKERCKEKGIPDTLCNARIGDQNKLKENGEYFVTLAINKKNPKDFYRILLKCQGKCETINDIVVKDIDKII
ncbi:hypothetical protein [Helicobacter sp.]|uniref:hypothetical protein n=1 Tax=Helicobacter sp. TaxID=218 RepID=UPI002A90927C|nr:hypothetical protein [Helicobacter sp.]MDY5556731.1 hypothetical protein [Helicobacter sp.]